MLIVFLAQMQHIALSDFWCCVMNFTMRNNTIEINFYRNDHENKNVLLNLVIFPQHYHIA